MIMKKIINILENINFRLNYIKYIKKIINILLIFLEIFKIFFDHSIFLHQKNGGISKYFSRLIKSFKDPYFGVQTKIFCPITINDNISEIQSRKKLFFIKLEKIPRFCSSYSI